MLSIAHIRLIPLLLYLSLAFSAEAADCLGKPEQMYDNSGQLIWDAEYDSYGKVRKLKESSLKECPFRAPGQYFDSETGLHYNRHRYYCSESGAYISQDPIRLDGGAAFYAYVKDSNCWIDPFGLDWVNPNSLNFSQGYVDNKVLEYEKLMRDGNWDFERSPLNVVNVDGVDVSLDNRRLLAAQRANIPAVKINRVNLDDAMPGGGTYGGNLRKKLNSRPPKRPDLPKIKLGPTGTSKQPKIVKSCLG